VSVNTKRVFYVRHLFNPNFLATLSTRPEYVLDKIDPSADADPTPILSVAHVFQIGSVRNELDLEYFANKSLFARAPNLLVVSTHGAGYDTVDLEACTAAGVIAVNQAGANREAVAEHVLGMMLCLSKKIIQTDRILHRESGVARQSFLGNDIFGKSVGIIGFGNTGSRVAELCKGLFGMRVLAYDPYLSEDAIRAKGGEKIDALDTLMGSCDFISINCPLVAETRGMIGSRQYAAMQKHAFLITTARGGICDEVALADALGKKLLAGAGIDVWDEEPPRHDHPLLQFDNVLASPHIAGATIEARVEMGRMAAEQIFTILDGKRPPRFLNPEAWPAYRRRFVEIMGATPEE
jgi:D-3-phosphoglycerate dehydrogenase